MLWEPEDAILRRYRWGLDQIDGRVFDGFDYVALGHIHSPQHVGKETIRYCGTPLKYSFSEAGHKKSVTVAEFKEKGNVEIKTIPLTPRLDLRKIKGTYLEVTDRKAYTEENRYDYMQITLTDEEDIPNAMARLRTIYPNLMSLAYDNTRTRENREIQGLQEQSRKTELELFGEFFEKLNNEPMKEEQEEYMKNLIRKLKEETNETVKADFICVWPLCGSDGNRFYQAWRNRAFSGDRRYGSRKDDNL